MVVSLPRTILRIRNGSNSIRIRIIGQKISDHTAVAVFKEKKTDSIATQKRGGKRKKKKKELRGWAQQTVRQCRYRDEVLTRQCFVVGKGGQHSSKQLLALKNGQRSIEAREPDRSSLDGRNVERECAGRTRLRRTRCLKTR